ncbi:YaiO family outer membrane beta-barrel protein [Aurantiacibacter poecillastricola]|uniref:YaiO family outer membrane beta-barrel protein n=1 Tax=Aurantiacibacter poecillastricola TaxID=3064385 RepID=UPI00273F80B0|nr:YaiO family outer membrane beta-barrel protein [Aurantiacibacter sp. 219JJ12-13]MDP5262392.1 YaiO family outer membrane beta-barrel protein [Aurantiacibacter sp. 219JJ12-13]
MTLRLLTIVFLLSVFGTAPALAQDSLYERGVAARLADDPELAASLLENWLAQHPGDVDALVQYGYALLALGRLDEARSAFESVLETAPDYTDAAQGLSLVVARRNSSDGAARGFVLVQGGLSDPQGQDNWHELGIVASLPIDRETTADVAGTWFERFGAEDAEVGVLVTHRATQDLWLRLGGSVTPSADFRPETGITAGFDARIAESTVARLDGSWQRFPLQEVWMISPGFTQYFGGGRFAASLTGRIVSAEGEDAQIGGTLRADYLPRERTRLFVGVAAGPETDLGVVRDTTSAFLGGEIPLTEDLSLLGSVAQEWRENGGNRSEARIGIKLAL